MVSQGGANLGPLLVQLGWTYMDHGGHSGGKAPGKLA